MINWVSAVSPTPISILPTYYCSVPFRLATHDSNNVKQLKQAVQVYRVQEIVQKRNTRNKSRFKRQYEHKFL